DFHVTGVQTCALPISVEATEDDVRQALAELTPERRSSVDIAGLNAPCQTVLSGDAEGIERVLARLEGKRAVRLSVSHAFHSPHKIGRAACRELVETSA